MSAMQILFLITAAVTLGGAVMVVTARDLVHMALWLILSLFGVAIMFALLSAPFFSVVQVVIYIGAISILMIFAIMLTRRSMKESGSSVNQGWWLAAPVEIPVGHPPGDDFHVQVGEPASMSFEDATAEI